MARILQILVTTFIIVTILFFSIRLTGDPTTLIAPPEATAADIERIRVALGVDKSLGAQYVSFLSGLMRLDLGTSFRMREDAALLVIQRLPATLTLAVASILVAIAIAVPAGILAGAYPRTRIDRVTEAISVFGQSVPPFWFGILLIILFSVQLRLLPAFGNMSIQGLILPVLTLSLYSVPIVLRLTRTQFLNILNADFIRTARATGVSNRRILYKYALKNAAIPILAIIGVRFNAVIGGTVVVEAVFGYPGVGSLALQALQTNDFPLVQAFVIIVALMVAAVNVLLETSYTFLNPRAREA